MKESDEKMNIWEFMDKHITAVSVILIDFVYLITDAIVKIFNGK